MAKKYTAADFANARFAEHPETGRRLVKCDDVAGSWRDQHGMAWTNGRVLEQRGWVPVPTKPVLTESEVKKMVGNYGVDDFAAGFAGGFRYAGGEVIPDPEPTNTEKLEQLIRESGARIDANGIAKYLDKHGVTAPNVKDN